MPSTANIGPQVMPRHLEHINLLASRNERESIRIAIRPKVSWASSGVAGSVLVQCGDLCSASGDRLVVGQSLKLRCVIPILGVPDARVPLDLPVSQINLLPGETAAIWVSIDVPSDQPPGQYEGDIIITATKPETQSSAQRSAELIIFSEFSDNGPVDMMDGDAILNLSNHLKINLTVWDFVLPATPSLPAVFGISDTVIEGRFGVAHGSEDWYQALDLHLKWLLQFRISPYFCRWGDSMRVLTYTCPWPADHPKSDEYFSDPRLSAYAVPYSRAFTGDAFKEYLRQQVEILRSKSHWKKAYFYLWDEICLISEHANATQLGTL